MKMVEFVRSLWVRLMQRRTLHASKNARFNMLYRVTDPWRMTSDAEQQRFRETNRLIGSNRFVLRPWSTPK